MKKENEQRADRSDNKVGAASADEKVVVLVRPNGDPVTVLEPGGCIMAWETMALAAAYLLAAEEIRDAFTENVIGCRAQWWTWDKTQEAARRLGVRPGLAYNPRVTNAGQLPAEAKAIMGQGFFSAEKLDPAMKCWLIADRKSGMPLTVEEGSQYVLMFWSAREGAEDWRRQDKTLKKAKIVPWKLSQVVAFCRRHGIESVMPDRHERSSRVHATVSVASIEEVLRRNAAPGN